MRFKIVLIGLVLGLFVGCDSSQVESAIAAPRTTEALYYQSCASCHETGRAGAPKRAKLVDWQQRTAKDEQELLASVINGFRGMPARGMCSDCSDEELFQLVKFLMPVEPTAEVAN
ncbi:c-type cytochrome [uncultured Umboniibacter sp.]|uniref:c-type cytochrome n=1 Tax=uncultured Umboniibacter sp. TaxID=1798917 RepID=UPI0026136F56|nr:c-type cytochrome [uncultured Umboniibacter sp.]